MWVCPLGPRGPEVFGPPSVSHTLVLPEAAMVLEGLGGSWGSREGATGGPSVAAANGRAARLGARKKPNIFGHAGELCALLVLRVSVCIL